MENKHLNKLGMVGNTVSPIFRKLRQDNQGHPVLHGKFKVGLYYITKPCCRLSNNSSNNKKFKRILN